MITSRLKGGIGNVMFQIAASYGFASVCKTAVGFDLLSSEILNDKFIQSRGVTNYSYMDNILKRVHHRNGLLNIKKAGHAGTLDPFATGVLICCINNCNRTNGNCSNSTKCSPL